MRWKTSLTPTAVLVFYWDLLWGRDYSLYLKDILIHPSGSPSPKEQLVTLRMVDCI